MQLPLPSSLPAASTQPITVAGRDFWITAVMSFPSSAVPFALYHLIYTGSSNPAQQRLPAAAAGLAPGAGSPVNALLLTFGSSTNI